MRKFMLAMVMVLSTVSFAAAQSQSNVEGYLGLQYVRSDFDYRVAPQNQFNFNRATDSLGASAAVTGFFSENVGLTGELSATFKGGATEGSLVTALGGVTFKARSNPRFQPFVRALVGVARERIAQDQLNFNVSDVGFAAVLGGGLDLNLSTDSRYKIRLFGVDYMRTSGFDTGVNGFINGGRDHIRLSTGLVW